MGHGIAIVVEGGEVNLQENALQVTPAMDVMPPIFTFKIMMDGEDWPWVMRQQGREPYMNSINVA